MDIFEAATSDDGNLGSLVSKRRIKNWIYIWLKTKEINLFFEMTKIGNHNIENSSNHKISKE